MSSNNNTITIGCLHFDMVTNHAFYSGNDLSLSPKEFALLFLLAQAEGKMLSAQHLFERVWKKPFEEGNSTLKVHIFNLKKKLAAVADEILIESYENEGYCLVKI